MQKSSPQVRRDEGEEVIPKQVPRKDSQRQRSEVRGTQRGRQGEQKRMSPVAHR